MRRTLSCLHSPVKLSLSGETHYGPMRPTLEAAREHLEEEQASCPMSQQRRHRRPVGFAHHECSRYQKPPAHASKCSCEQMPATPREAVGHFLPSNELADLIVAIAGHPPPPHFALAPGFPTQSKPTSRNNTPPTYGGVSPSCRELRPARERRCVATPVNNIIKPINIHSSFLSVEVPTCSCTTAVR